MKALRNLTPRSARPLRDWPADLTRSENRWSRRPDCPMLPRQAAAYGFLRDRLSITTGALPLPPALSDGAVDATLRLMLRRGTE